MDKKKILLAAGKLALRYLETKSGHESETEPVSQKNTVQKKETPPGIAKPGEKVISLVTTDHDRLGEYDKAIQRGEILTVQSIGYAFETYCFVERPSSYDPYLGEEATWWYPVRDFFALGGDADRIIAFLNSVDARAEACLSKMEEALRGFQPGHALNQRSSIEEYRECIAEYSAFVKNFEPLLKTEVEAASSQELKQLLKDFTVQANGKDFSLDIQKELEKFAAKVEASIRDKCDWVFPDADQLKNRSAMEKMKLPFEKKNRLSELTGHIEQNFKVCAAACGFQRELRNQYAGYIIAALKTKVGCVDFPNEE